MLVKEKNDLITQTGPGTPMGEVFRCYWLPALLAMISLLTGFAMRSRK